MEIGGIKTETVGEQAKWPKLSISSVELKSWEETRTALLWSQPAFADVWYRMMQDKDKELAWFTDQTPWAATDDKFLYINPRNYFRMTLNSRVFIACHDILHCIMNHCGIMNMLKTRNQVVYPDGLILPFDMDICQVSTDCLINDMLLQGKVGTQLPIHPDTGQSFGRHMPELITYMDDIYSAYRKLFQKQQGQKQQGANNTPTLGGNFDEHLTPGKAQGKTATEAQEERNPQAWDNALAAALKAAKQQGRLSAALERGLSKLLEPRVDWQDRFRFVASKHLGNDNSTWSMLDNEMMIHGIGAPGRTKYSCELIICAADTSGSINQNTLDMFFSEVSSILAIVRPHRLILVQCDAEITEWIEIDYEDNELCRKLKGGGGTDFRPVFERIEEEGLTPNCLVYLTDLAGTFPSEAPHYPVIWATIEKGTAPFGEIVEIPGQIDD